MSDDVDDKTAFKAAMQGVMPLRSDDKHHHKPQSPAPSVAKHSIEKTFQDAPLSDGMYTEKLSGDTPLFFARSGVQPKTLADLKRGKLPIEDRLDLHGMYVEQARTALFSFLQEAQQSGLRQVLVIHGKGGKHENTPSVIKSSVNTWLPQLEIVLAFASAQAKHGGTGAVIVLLKRMAA